MPQRLSFPTREASVSIPIFQLQKLTIPDRGRPGEVAQRGRAAQGSCGVLVTILHSGSANASSKGQVINTFGAAGPTGCSCSLALQLPVEELALAVSQQQFIYSRWQTAVCRPVLCTMHAPNLGSSGERWDMGWKLRSAGSRERPPDLCSPLPAARDWILIQMLGSHGRNVGTVTWSASRCKSVEWDRRPGGQLIGKHSPVTSQACGQLRPSDLFLSPRLQSEKNLANVSSLLSCLTL